MQNAYVTHDLDKAMEIIGNRYGVEKFDRFDPGDDGQHAQGPQPMVNRVASYWAGGLNIEMIEPVSGYIETIRLCSPPTKPTRCRASTTSRCAATTRRKCARRSPGWGCRWRSRGRFRQGGDIPSLVFVYLDGRASLGHYVEFTWKSPEAWKFVGWPEGRPVW